MKCYGWLATLFSVFCRINSLWILQYLQISSVSNYCRDEYLAKSYAVQTVAWLTLGALFYIFLAYFLISLGFA